MSFEQLGFSFPFLSARLIIISQPTIRAVNHGVEEMVMLEAGLLNESPSSIC
jgi:hypothetical protein